MSTFCNYAINWFTKCCGSITFEFQLHVWGSGVLLGKMSLFILIFVVLTTTGIVAAILLWPLHHLQVFFIITETWKILNKDSPLAVLLAPPSRTTVFHDLSTIERNVDGWSKGESRILCQLFVNLITVLCKYNINISLLP